MRIVVISDSHRAIGKLLEIIELHRNTADLFIFLGDIDDDFDTVLDVYPSIKYYRVVGNNDWYSHHPDEQIIDVQGKRIFFAHGHTYGVKHGYEKIIEHSKEINADICLFGHTHLQYTNYDDGLYIMNPGSVRMGEYGMIDILKEGIMLLPADI